MSNNSINLGQKLKHDFDLLIVILGIAIFPLAGSVDDYFVSKYSSVYSGMGIITVFPAALGMIMFGLIIRIYRYWSERL